MFFFVVVVVVTFKIRRVLPLFALSVEGRVAVRGHAHHAQQMNHLERVTVSPVRKGGLRGISPLT